MTIDSHLIFICTQVFSLTLKMLITTAVDGILIFWMGFSKNPSFKIGMSGRMGGRLGSSQVNRLVIFFFQSYMLPLLFSGVLSNLVGMKRRTSRCFTRKGDNSHFLRYLKTHP